MGIRGVDDAVAKKLVELGSGVMVERDVLNIVRKIQEYDENLIVTHLDPNVASDITDAPYRIMELCPDGLRRPVMDVWELDDRVLERLYALDNQRNSVLDLLDEKNALATLAEKRRYKEEIASVSEMVQGILRSPKDTYTATNPVSGIKMKFRSTKQSDD